MLLWNAKANSIGKVIMWIVGIIAVFMCAIWIFKSLDAQSSVSIDHVHHDLENLQIKFAEACNSRSYSGKYNPMVEKGNLTLHDDEICIITRDFSSCAYLMCSTSELFSTNLEDITYIVLEKTDDGNYSLTEE